MPGPSPTPPTPSRHIELSGCCNFRDLGGYPTRDGRRTAWQRVFRADGLTDLTDDDLVILEGIGIATVIDLRTDLEVETRGRFPEHVDHIAYYHLPLTDTLPGEEQAPDWRDPGFVAERYRTMVADGAVALSRAVELLADPANLPAVFHCSVGKDRTGVLAAVVLGLLGVADDVIAQDYALSGQAMMRVLERLEREYPDADEIIERYRPVILSADPASVLGLLDALRAGYGSLDAWATGLGLEVAVTRLRDVLLVPA